MTLTYLTHGAYEFYISFERNSYIATVADLTEDWKNRRHFSASFGNGILAESRILEWMDNPEEVLKDCLSRNEAIARGLIKIVTNHVPKSF